jgi:hypothetical protein
MRRPLIPVPMWSPAIAQSRFCPIDARGSGSLPEQLILTSRGTVTKPLTSPTPQRVQSYQE